MYYIINQNNQIIATDIQLLSEVGTDNADTFYKKVALGEIFFELEEEAVVIHIDDTHRRYRATVSPLASVLGDIRLVVIHEALSMNATSEPEIQEEEMILLDDVDLFETKEPSAEEESPIPIDNTDTEEEALFELILPTDAENAISTIDNDIETSKIVEEQISTNEATEAKTDEEQNTPIFIDIERISEKIGISADDYNLFLNEYIDTALTFEQALQGQNEKEQEEAINTLTHLSHVLHLPFVGNILEQIKSASQSERDSAIASFFATLGRLTTAHFDEEKRSSEEILQTEETQEETSQEAVPSTEHKTPIDLSGVKAIHFDFQLEEAAKDLSLPIELIEEFVNDFITQAHEETKKMLAAYENGDLETVQKIGHLLKGTSSNLRINPLSDTLYEIQFNEDIDRVPELIKNYWAHFLSLENQIKLISNT
jgi:hypothetical protein